MDLKILEIASDTENHEVIKNYTHQSKNKNPLCGDVMEISLIIKNDIILNDNLVDFITESQKYNYIVKELEKKNISINKYF